MQNPLWQGDFSLPITNFKGGKATGEVCKYKDVFGKPNQGVHSYRMAGLAIVDVGFTILAAWLLSYLLNWNFIICLVGFLLAGILAHRLFCVRTKIDTILFT